jgi:hypothetical protein
MIRDKSRVTETKQAFFCCHLLMKPAVKNIASLFHCQFRMIFRSKYDNAFIFDVYCNAST